MRLRRVQRSQPSVIDLGCGPGNSTEVLAACYPQAHAAGIDSSEDMIKAARARLPQISFSVQDLQTWADPGPFDVILANAVLQWVPDHELVLPALVAKLAPGGSLAVQMPDNLDEPAHRMMREVAATGPWAAKLAAASSARVPLPDARWYYTLLRPLCARVDLWRTTYFHSLPGGATAVVEWFKGSGLRPFLEPLNSAERSAYLERYTAEIATDLCCRSRMAACCCRFRECSWRQRDSCRNARADGILAERAGRVARLGRALVGAGAPPAGLLGPVSRAGRCASRATAARGGGQRVRCASLDPGPAGSRICSDGRRRGGHCRCGLRGSRRPRAGWRQGAVDSARMAQARHGTHCVARHRRNCERGGDIARAICIRRCEHPRGGGGGGAALASRFSASFARTVQQRRAATSSCSAWASWAGAS